MNRMRSPRRQFFVFVGLTALMLGFALPGVVHATDPDRTEAAPIVIQHFRPHDARGINMFEPTKEAGVDYDGFKLMIGAAFTQQFQSIDHKNSADPDTAGGQPDQNALKDIGKGFNNAVANLYIDAQLAQGIRVETTIYLSSRHHREAWVKDGYLLIDGSPYDNETLDNLMKYLTLRIGHFEVNYGDAHFRRTDNGNAIYNPLTGNLIMDAFTTEIGAEAYVHHQGLMAMVGATGGEIRGTVLSPDGRAPSYLFKGGYDGMVNDDTRVRLMGSLYTTTKSLNNTLFTGDRAGSRYYYALEDINASETSQAWSGRIRPDLRSKVTSWVINPFIKYRNIELFGNLEQAKGRAASESEDRTFDQYAVEGLVRFADDQLYVAGRYNQVKGKFAGFTNDFTVNRVQIGGGWFITDNILLKTEYVNQKFEDFPSSDHRSGGEFDGMMIEGVVAF